MTQNDYLKIINFDDDYYNKWEALRKLHSYYFENKLDDEFIKVIKSLALNNKINNSVLAMLLKEPSFEMFTQSRKTLDPLDIFNKRQKYIKVFLPNWKILFVLSC